MLYSVFVYPELKIAYYSVPKAASRSITDFFDAKSSNCIKMRVKDFIDNEDYYKFSFVRNPYDRIISLYVDKVLSRRIDRGLSKTGLSRYMRFDEFVNKIVSNNPKRADKHIKPQYLLIPKDANFIGKIEEMDKHFNIMLKDIGIDGELKTIGKSVKLNHNKILTKDIRKTISEYYKRDFQEFNYEI